MFDHIGFNVSDFSRSREFYVRALAPLGIAVVMEGEGWAMLGKDGRGQLWIGAFGSAPSHVHIALDARDRSEVIAFHTAALKAGGKDNGGPGIREQYHPNYYGAFVLCPDGHNIEAVCHKAEG